MTWCRTGLGRGHVVLLEHVNVRNGSDATSLFFQPLRISNKMNNLEKLCRARDGDAGRCVRLLVHKGRSVLACLFACLLACHTRALCCAACHHPRRNLLLLLVKLLAAFVAFLFLLDGNKHEVIQNVVVQHTSLHTYEVQESRHVMSYYTIILSTMQAIVDRIIGVTLVTYVKYAHSSSGHVLTSTARYYY